MFASEYGWTQEYALSKTLYQSKHLSKQIGERRSDERRITANMLRVAQHGDKSQFDRFFDDLQMPSEKKSRKKKVKTEIPSESVIPPGFTHIKD